MTLFSENVAAHWLGLVFTFSLIICSLFIPYCLYILYQHRKYAHIPGPPLDNFFLGHIPSLKRAYQNGKFSHMQFLEWAEQYGPIYKVFMLHKCILIPTSQAVIKEILTKSKHPKAKSTYSKLYNIAGVRFLGSGLVTNTNFASWSKRRHAIDPAMHRNILKDTTGLFNEVADNMVNKLRDYADGETKVSMVEFLSRVTLDAIGKVAFGQDLGCIDDPDSPFPKAMNTILSSLAISLRNPIFHYFPRYQKLVKDTQEAVAFLRGCGRKWLEERRNAIFSGEEVPQDLLTYIIKAQAEMPDLTDEDILDDFDTLFIAGQETTANCLSFLLCEVGRNSDILRKLRSELDRVMTEPRDVEFSDLGNMNYMAQVLKETLRMYPPAPATARDVISDTYVDGVRIPGNSLVVTSFYAVQRMRAHFDDPEYFDPARFKGDKERPLFAYLPFSMGQRTCMGRRFAQIEAKILLTKFFQNFDFELDMTQSFDVQETASLRPKGGAMMTLTLRN